MIAVFFFYGLAYFAMGLAVLLETRRSSELPFGRHLPWLGGFAVVHSIVEWCGMFLLVPMSPALHESLHVANALLLPISTLLLIRFGAGLVSEAGPLPEKLLLVSPALVVPGAFLAAYALIMTLYGGSSDTTGEVWSRYLLYLPGCLLAAFGLLRQWKRLAHSALAAARAPLFVAAMAFVLNAVVAGLITPRASFGLAPWLNYDNIVAVTGAPAQVWRALTAIVLAVCAVRTLDVFEQERHREIAGLQEQRDEAQSQTLALQQEARQSAETWTDSLVEISRRIAGMDDVDSILRLIVGHARLLLHSDTASLGLLNETGTQLDLKCYVTAGETQMVNGDNPVRSPFIIQSVRAGEPFCFPQDVQTGEASTATGDSTWICPVLKREIVAALVVPLQLEGRVLGALWVGRYAGSPFGSADTFSLQRLADQTVIALEHALMAARLQSLAITEERSRLAREMHDGLAQILSYLSVEVQTLEILAQQREYEQLIERLHQARAEIIEAHAEVRENILSLRTTLAGDVGLVPALQQYVDGFGEQTGIDIQVISRVEGMPRISPLAETQLVRIVQEALTNVRKHAHAQHASVELAAPDGHLAVAIVDDGIGFAGEPADDRFGLRIMRERAGSVGGTVTIRSQPGVGTEVHVSIPLVLDSGGKE
jgi:signal transduction histidine kinase